MNHKPNRSFFGRPIFRFAFFLLLSGIIVSPEISAQTTNTFYYWVAPGNNISLPEQSFVIAVDAAISAKIETILSNKGRPGFYGHIAAGTVSYNRDYIAPDHHNWNWYVASIDSIFDFNQTSIAITDIANVWSNPSDIAANPDAWIKQNGDVYEPIYYQIHPQIDPSRKDAMVNVSNRGLTGAGEKTLIAGFIVTGGEPRNIVVRALGPSLSASGIQQVAGNPAIGVFQGSNGVAGNRDWKNDLRADELRQKYPSLAPTDDKEAAILLTLLPGAYTLHGINEDGTEGIVLLEAYDVDSATNP